MKKYEFNKETLKIELRFEKADYQSMDEDAKSKLKSAFLWSGKSGAWVSRAKEPNLWRAKQVAEQLGFEKGEDIGERLSFAEQVELVRERAEARADRFEQYGENASKRAERLQGEFNECRKDWSWVTQPNINSTRGRAFTNQRNKIIARYERGFDEMNKAEYFKDRAETSRETANGKFDRPSYLNNRIKECKQEIKFLEQRICVEPLADRLERYQERLLTAQEKLEFMETRLAEITGGAK